MVTLPERRPLRIRGDKQATDIGQVKWDTGRQLTIQVIHGQATTTPGINCLGRMHGQLQPLNTPHGHTQVWRWGIRASTGLAAESSRGGVIKAGAAVAAQSK
mmetsp:Transcript_151601/g.282507  ORF Transcript_151601/g.282507 Transcript_151601/m.282507 type:complete len:102 (+) Transcript_151601:3-308(+)